jgi:hypothetical protein
MRWLPSMAFRHRLAPLEELLQLAQRILGLFLVFQRWKDPVVRREPHLLGCSRSVSKRHRLSKESARYGVAGKARFFLSTTGSLVVPSVSAEDLEFCRLWAEGGSMMAATSEKATIFNRDKIVWLGEGRRNGGSGVKEAESLCLQWKKVGGEFLERVDTRWQPDRPSFPARVSRTHGILEKTQKSFKFNASEEA